MAKNRKKKSHRIYAFFVLTLGIMIIVLSMLLLFHIQKIEVKGNNYCTDKEIVDLAKMTDFRIIHSMYLENTRWEKAVRFPVLRRSLSA